MEERLWRRRAGRETTVAGRRRAGERGTAGEGMEESEDRVWARGAVGY
jgi:hypothetical protein